MARCLHSCHKSSFVCETAKRNGWKHLNISTLHANCLRSCEGDRERRTVLILWCLGKAAWKPAVSRQSRDHVPIQWPWGCDFNGAHGEGSCIVEHWVPLGSTWKTAQLVREWERLIEKELERGWERDWGFNILSQGSSVIAGGLGWRNLHGFALRAHGWNGVGWPPARRPSLQGLKKRRFWALC